MKFLYDYFDKLEDKIRGKLSRYPIFYAFLGGIGVVTFWRGVWHTIDFLSEIVFAFQLKNSIDLGSLPWWDGPISFVVGSILLLSTGLFVFDFLGSQEILTNLKGEKKIAQKTEGEIRSEESVIEEIGREVKEISNRLTDIEKEFKN